MEAREESRTALLCLAPSASFFWLPQKSAFIKLASIRAAEKVEEKSFGSSLVMQIIYADDVGRSQTVYLQCKVRPVEGAVGRGFRSPPRPLSATLGTSGCVCLVFSGLMPRCVVHACYGPPYVGMCMAR